MENFNFYAVLSPKFTLNEFLETLWKLCVCAKLVHQDIR